MRLLRGATALALALSAVASALAAVPPGLRFGVYTAHVGLGGGGHLVADVSVLDPETKVTLMFACGRPTGADTVTEVWNSPAIALNGGSFSVRRTVSMSRFTTATQTNALVTRAPFTGTVDAEGSSTAHDQFVGTVEIEDSPCNRTSYTASWLPGPALSGPAP